MSKRKSSSLGTFTNFPSMTHGTARISHKTSNLRLQRIIIESLSELNGYNVPQVLSVASGPGTHQGEVKFEVGVADGTAFQFLDEETTRELMSPLKNRKPFPVLDVLIIVCYYYFKNDRKVPLNFDHHLLRFTFSPGELTTNLFHVKGIRRTPLEDLLHQVLNRVKRKMAKKRLKTFKLEYLRTL